MKSNQTSSGARRAAHPGRGLGALGASTAWCALLLYLGAATPLAPAFTALAAALDSSHHVAVALGGSGPQVVLRHDCATSLTHRHGPIARTLTFFAQRSGATQADHIIQFGAAGTVEPTSIALLSKPSKARSTSLTPAYPTGTPTVALQSFVINASPPTPPGAVAQWVALQTTVLLI